MFYEKNLAYLPFDLFLLVKIGHGLRFAHGIHQSKWCHEPKHRKTFSRHALKQVSSKCKQHYPT